MLACLHPWRRRAIFAHTLAGAICKLDFFWGGLSLAWPTFRWPFPFQLRKLTWLALGEDQAARFRRVEQLIAP